MRALAGLLVFLVAACGGTVSPSSTPLPTPTAHAPTAVIVADGQAVATPSQSAPTTQVSKRSDAVIDCGEITVSGQPPRAVSDPVLASGSTSCFANAYKACRAATLSVRDQDAGMLRQFAVLGNSPCDLRQALQTDPNAPPATADCTGLHIQNDGLLIQGCSHLGDYFIPIVN